jgi:hypothetical protein
MRFGGVEWTYAEPFAQAVVGQAAFRAWVLGRTRFAPCVREAVLLHEAMKSKRTKVAESWWRSHYTEKCRCRGCSGQETDLLAVFQVGKPCFALHIKVKQPDDDVDPKKDQAANYALRAECWVRQAPERVLPHAAADTMLLFSERRRAD